jgi:transmembrane sensor
MKILRIGWSRRITSGAGAPQDEPLIERALGGIRGADPDTARGWARLALNLGAEPDRSRPAVRRYGRFRPILFSTAGLAALVALFVLVSLYRDARSVYSTGRAQQTTIRLSDSTLVTLNHTSMVTIDFSGDGRRMATLDGEAYFEVRRNGTPFVVHTRAGDVEVLGTAFNVKARGGTTDLDVLHGRVRFGSAGQGGNGSIVLNGDEKSRCIEGAAPAAPVRTSHRSTPGWMEGKIACDQRPLRDLCRELEDTYDISVSIGDASLGNLTVTGTIEARSAGQAVQALSLLIGRQYRADHDTFVIY